MKTLFARSTAGIALAASLMGTAHANTADVDAGVSTDADNSASSAYVMSVPAASNVVDVPTALLDAFNATEGTAQALSTTAPTQAVSEIAPASSGVVTTRSLDPRYGHINPFYGDISPFYGNIDAFWGHISPFYGDISPFYGNINPFWGNISPFYGDITAFWGDIDAFYGNIGAFDAQNLQQLGDFWNAHVGQISLVEQRFNAITFIDGQIVRDGSPDRMMSAVADLVASGEAQFGSAYTAKTGQSFDTLVSEVFARHGATGSNHKAVIERWTMQQRAAFYLDWHDSLNQYSGIDAVDHWMAAVNWTPAITQIQGAGKDTVIGIIDSDFSSDLDLGNNIILSAGSSYNASGVKGHGAGVASLIAGAHDGEGVMGIAPDAKLATYNPFDSQGKGSWNGVGNGLVHMKRNLPLLGGKVSVVNISLGEKGSVFTDGTADFLDRWDVNNYYDDTVFVFAAGNDGIAQNWNIDFKDADKTALIFVGSVNPLGEISSFSNRPGNGCLTGWFGRCDEANKLYMRTVVAPGELILVSDGQGGVVRRSGTSFAAPLVSGAVALLHNRWPWLRNNPHESAQIIFRSARDLGAPGPDEVYGWGLLDVAASQSPLDFNAMSFKIYEQNGQYWYGRNLSAADVLGAGIPAHWETNNAFFTGFENIGNTYRDFSIPVSAFAYGKSTNALGRGFERLQDYVSQRFSTWIQSGGQDANGNGRAGFSELRQSGGAINGEWTIRYDAMAPRYDQQGQLRMVHGAATLTEPSGKASFTFGHGQGSMALSGYRFGIMSDHDPFTGGVNPVLGFASGETFAQAGYKLAENTTVRVGYSQNNEGNEDVAPDDTVAQFLRSTLGDRSANALTLDLEQKVSDAVSFGAQLTMLDENDALLGTQTGTEAFLGNGSQTEAMTLSASVALGAGFSVDVSATGARTSTAKDQLFTNAGTVWATAGQFSATKRGLFSGSDMLRISVAQPLQVEDGELQFTSDQVVNRETGEIGKVTQTFGIGTKRRITTEAIYATQLTGSSEFGVFGRYVSAGDSVDQAGMVVGGNFSLRF
ncbi:S8 family serine peptidase [Erythrobacter sp. SCSIO 43205]|uniref:S8 family peptidase n=1 Tax=Erythrobacter sp. SCSIO 43205 TaxID=2779361 RepID=UPI001CA9F653|nr:S8 family peptidase [Erythrobacter sp. SCSIO 43205]UAB79353.1 S8 family serine peptidase [Erythrobacter sp. SCSIO 43205]